MYVTDHFVELPGWIVVRNVRIYDAMAVRQRLAMISTDAVVHRNHGIGPKFVLNL